MPDRAALEAASKRLSGVAHRTPVLTSSLFDSKTGASLYFKCENFQRMGAFKCRGAYNTVGQLTRQQLENGVITHSSGNHAQALALAARERGTAATIVMPRTAPEVKVAATRGYGAEVIFCEPTQAAREGTVAGIVEKRGAFLVHPYDDPRIIAGQSTAAQELLADVPGLDFLIVPVGGGGLLAGTALAAAYFSSGTAVWGAEPSGADDAWRSLQAGEWVPSESPRTIADGLLTSLGKLNFEIIRRHVSGIVTVDDESIIDAMQRVFERMKIVIEPSAAVPLAAVLEGRIDFAGRRVGIILSGGNVDLGRLPWSAGRSPGARH